MWLFTPFARMFFPSFSSVFSEMHSCTGFNNNHSEFRMEHLWHHYFECTLCNVKFLNFLFCFFFSFSSFSFVRLLPLCIYVRLAHKCRHTIVSKWDGNRIWTKTITIHHCGWTRQWIDWITIPMKQQAFQKLTFWNIWRFPYLNKVSKTIQWKWWEVTKGESKTIYPNENHHTQNKIFAQISDFCGFSYEIVQCMNESVVAIFHTK